ncbi:hypothetical protein [Streptomyces sp. ME18-1-4]|uniref:hypothetical protein n=1 Tax=Streptomyces sp. ME18-1-4 TaxID=3028685 RepID=UPI0029CA6CD5|nr:hypothetical protein [Streptomyces sp. ME18-1-4]
MPLVNGMNGMSGVSGTDGMSGIEFFHYPWADHPTALVWGIRVDGTDLRALTARATRELWRPELEDQFEEEEQERESAELIWRQHDGLGVLDFTGNHFLDAADRTPLLGCPCGLWQCWTLMARIGTTSTTVTWSAFHQPEREEWGELPIGPFVFERTAYETALRNPPVLREDPLGPPSFSH